MKTFCDTIAESLAQYETNRYWASKLTSELIA